MATYLRNLMTSQLTIIPQIIENSTFGEYYNNSLCNGATWMFLLWYLLHAGFDSCFEPLLRRMRYKEYIRIRIQQSLWYIGFYSAATVYCLTILYENQISLENLFTSTTTQHNYFVLGTILLTTFFIHSALWEFLNCCYSSGISFFLLTIIVIISFFFRVPQVAFTITALTGITRITLDLTKCVICVKLAEKNYLFMKILGDGLFISNILIFIVNYLFIMDRIIIVPLVKQFMIDDNIALALYTSIIIGWVISEIYNSLLYKCVYHWIFHNGSDEKSKCDNNIQICSLFVKRNDVEYNLKILRKEMKERETRNVSMRKPKNKMLMQTIRYMMTMKRKIQMKKNAKTYSTLGTNEDDIDNQDQGALVDPNINEVVDGKLQFLIQNSDTTFEFNNETKKIENSSNDEQKATNNNENNNSDYI